MSLLEKGLLFSCLLILSKLDWLNKGLRNTQCNEMFPGNLFAGGVGEWRGKTLKMTPRVNAIGYQHTIWIHRLGANIGTWMALP